MSRAIRLQLTAALLSAILCVAGASSARAYTPEGGQQACDRMMGLKVMGGKGLDPCGAQADSITRAEFTAILMRAFGQVIQAGTAEGTPSFPDAGYHWASGIIAKYELRVAEAGGDPVGLPGGKFAPNATVTPAEMVAFMMKALGVRRDPAKSWPDDYLGRAVEAGMITTDQGEYIKPIWNQPGTRGLAFYLLDHVSYNFDIGRGKTIYTTYADPTPPELQLDPPTTTDISITISGTVTGAPYLFVNGEPVAIDREGRFTSVLLLREAMVAGIVVTAQDIAGNQTEKSITWTKTQ